MRIAILVEGYFPYVGGGQVYVREVARRLVERYGCSADILTRSIQEPGERGYFPRKKTYYGGRLKIIRLGPPLPFLNVVGRLSYLAIAFCWLVSHRYDLYNPQTFLPGAPAKLASLFTRTPVVYTIHGTVLFSLPPRSLRKRIERALERMLLLRTRYDAEITVARNFLELPNRNTRIEVIPPGVDTQPFDAVTVPKERVFTLLYVGRFDPVKGVADILQAVAILKREDAPPFHLWLVGYGPEEAVLRALVQKLALVDTVFFRGKLEGEDLVRAYKSSHLFVLPSYSEGFPVTILEAWAARLPVVVTDVGDNRVIVEEGVTGFLVPPYRPASLAAAILRAYRNPHLAEIGARGYAHVRSRYRWEDTTRKVYTVYDEVLKRAIARVRVLEKTRRE